MWCKTRDSYHNLAMCRSIRYGVTHASDPNHVPGTPAVDMNTAFVSLFYGMHRDGQNVHSDNVTVVEIPACTDAHERLKAELAKLDKVLQGESPLWDVVDISPHHGKRQY